MVQNILLIAGKFQDPGSQARLWNIFSNSAAALHNLQSREWGEGDSLQFGIKMINFNFNLHQRREQVEKETRILREKISVLKIHISTITKGVPISKIEVREDKRSLMRSSSPDEKMRSISLPASGKPQDRSFSPTMKHPATATAHILKSQQSLASEILA